jgi:tRNA A37 methylthiotransferase MiaB
LVLFAKKYEFDSVSMFGYHDEKLASSSKLDNKVTEEIIKKRVKIMSGILNKIYEKKEKERI